MTCKKCQGIRKEIKVPDDLIFAIKRLRSKIEDGTLKYIGEGPYGEPFSRIALGNGWGDFVNNYFKCNYCKQLFNLHAETYHGGGGRLEPVEKNDGMLTEDEAPFNQQF